MAIVAKVGWSQAKDLCSKMGGHLAYIETADEMRFLQALVGRTAWVGATDQHKDGDWRWLSGAPVDSVLWAPGKPAKDNASNCAALNLSGLVHYWNTDCNFGIFICEWE